MHRSGQSTTGPENWLSVGGEVAADLLEVDWSTTPVGAPKAWPSSLRTMVRALLGSRFSMWMAWGPELTFFCNDAYRRDTLGTKYPWALGRPAREVWSEIWSEIGPRIETVLRTGTATWDESLLLFLERSGYVEETYHTFSYSPLPDDEGRIAGMLCVVTEETERVVNERRMATLRDLGNVPSTGGDPYEFLRAAATHLALNRQSLPFTAAYLFDETGAADLAATTRLDAGHPVAPTRIEPGQPGQMWPVDRLLAGESVRVDALPGELPSGVSDQPPVEAYVVPMAQVGDRRPYGFLAVGINQHRPNDESYRAWIGLIAQRLAAGVAAARSLEIERRRNEQLAELDRAKTAFFSNISHEFRTPLTLMLGPLEDALAAPDGMASDQVELVHRNGMRLLKLVGALLDFSRLEAGRMRADFRPVEIGRLTRELAATFSDACRRAHLELRIETEEPSSSAYVDPDLWERIVLNLVSNAFKVTLEGHIAVRVTEAHGQVELRVEDTGPGIPEPEIDRLFQRFHRVQSLQARSNEGTGIGLALVKELVELHGGEVAVESVLGAGSTFIVRLPLGREHLPEDRVSDEPASQTPTSAALYVEEALGWVSGDEGAGEPAADRGEARVLVADDNPDLRRYLVRLLEPQWHVEAVSDGRTALDRIQSDPPDLLITDVMMPGLDGFELLHAVRQSAQTRELPVIMLSARAGEEASIEGLQAGADDYLAKPFSGRELLARVQGHLDLARVRRQASDELRAKSDRLEEALAQLLRSQQLIAAQRDIMALIAEGATLERSLEEIVRWVELIAEHGARGSVLLLSEDGRSLRHGAAPSLPDAYNDAIDGIRLGPSVGSCGTAAYLSEPVIVEDIATDPRWSDFQELAAEHGLRSCWSLPIVAADGRLVGTFALYHDHPATPNEEDLRLVELLARTAAVAIERNRDLQARARQLAELQSSLLPRALPEIPGVSVAASFRPGDRSLEVGGDFYDVFVIQDGCWGFIVGDVCGHGAEAAAVTALTRYTAKAIAPREPDPAAVLHAVSDTLLRSGYDRFCTAVFGRVTARPGEPVVAEMACGGHPAPLVRRAGGEVESLAAHGPLLGVFDDPQFPLLSMELRPGDTLLLYTDGLVERNSLVPDEDALRDLLALLTAESATALVDALERTAIPAVPVAGRDDVAIVALRADS